MVGGYHPGLDTALSMKIEPAPILLPEKQSHFPAHGQHRLLLPLAVVMVSPILNSQSQGVF